jgi:murein DD-endopeptidase MepM/ murein hydrolase activator NlpD
VPAGFPIDPATPLGLVTGSVGSRVIEWGAGPGAYEYSLNDQPSGDPDWANRAGWNCRVHVEYEASPAVDWYIPAGTPLIATMDGTATLGIVTTANAFDHYGVSREPYLGNPDRARAPLSAFPGPGGGRGVFVTISNAEYTADYAHLDITATLAVVPGGAYVAGFSERSEYTTLFSPMRDFRESTVIAQWEVRRGDVIGYSGDSGYSEAPHLHYTVRHAGGPLLCPTPEADFQDGGWLFR